MFSSSEVFSDHKQNSRSLVNKSNSPDFNVRYSVGVFDDML